MTKAELITALSSKTGTDKKAVGDIVDSLFSLLTEKMRAGEKIKIVGFGEFSVHERKGRIGINPRTLEKIEIAQSRTPKFKAGHVLRKAMRL